MPDLHDFSKDSRLSSMWTLVDKHKLVCPELASRNSEFELHYQVRGIRNRSGATIENADAIPKARLPETKAEREILDRQDLSESVKDHSLR